MPEKGLNSAPLFISRPNNWWFSWRFSIWAVSVFLGMLFVWCIDTSAISNGVQAWRNRGDYLGLRPPLLTNSTQFHQHSLRPPNSTLPSQHFVSSNSTILLSTPNDNSSVMEQVVPTHNNNLSWISVDSDPNFTSNLLSQWLAPGGEPCRDSKTSEIAIQNLDSILQFYTGEVHELMIQALDGDGKPRCIGGDYFETDLSSQSWKSRPPIKDFSNGSYSIKLQVHPRFPGLYNLTIVLLFRRFEGLKLSPERFAVQKQLLNLSINFINFNSSSSPTIPQLHQCRRTDFVRQIWSGRWTRHARNDNCRIDRDGRFRCLDGDHKCEKTWCYGSLAAIESNGWVYSAHCSFMVFSQLQAWNCLHNRWIFFWGDSNHVDSIRNMLNFVLGLPHIKSVPRRFDTNFTNPFNHSQSVRITSIFNGHYNDSLNYQGLHSLQDKPYRDLISSYFSEPAAAPDTVVMNSGLHDGVHWRTVRAFVGGAEYAAKFWAELVESVRRRGLPAPVIVYRSTVATGGYARKLAFNPQKMEAFNGILVEKLKNYGILGGFVDGFDMTFPWHFDNRCNDGVHYGRAPAKARWRDGEIGHQYFVDVMLGHVLLNAICARFLVLRDRSLDGWMGTWSRVERRILFSMK